MPWLFVLVCTVQLLEKRAPANLLQQWPVACPACTVAPFRLAALYAGRVFSNCLKILPLWPLSL